MSHLNWIDLIILAIFFLSIIAGFVKGFIREIISLVTLIAAFVIAIMFSNALASMFTSSDTVQSAMSQSSSAIGTSTENPVSYVAIGLSFILLFIGTIIVGSIVSFILNIAFQTGILGFGNRLLGAGFGLVRGFIINLVLIFFVQLTAFGSEAAWHESRFVNYFQPAVEWLGNVVSPSLAHLKDKFSQTVENVNSQIQNVTP